MYRRRYSNSNGYFENIGKADCQVSVRLPKRIYDVINEYEGSNFSDRLINYVFDTEDNKQNPDQNL